jgi:hypothetical protein
MNKNRVTTLIAIAAVAGVIQALEPVNTTEMSRNNVPRQADTSSQNTTGQNPPAESSVVTPETAVPVSAPSSDSLLGEMKVYPSF